MVVQFGIQIELNMGLLLVYSVTRVTIWSLAILVSRKGKWQSDSVSMVNWMLVCLLLRRLRKPSIFSGP
jgi:hypothetical protein